MTSINDGMKAFVCQRSLLSMLLKSDCRQLLDLYIMQFLWKHFPIISINFCHPEAYYYIIKLFNHWFNMYWHPVHACMQPYNSLLHLTLHEL